MLSRATSLRPATSAVASRALSTQTAAPTRPNVVLVDGVRLPFAMAGTIYKDLMAVDLARMAIKGLIDHTAIDPKDIDYVLMGNVVQEVRTSNIAREASLAAGLPMNIASHTVSQACISSNAAICSGAEKIMSGSAEVILAGGCETFSDVPIRYSKPVRQRLIGAAKAMKKGVPGVLNLLKGLKLKDLAPEPPAIRNFSTGEIMGHSSDRLASRFGVSRQEQDDFTYLSHVNAHKAHEAGMYDAEVLPFNGVRTENGIRGDTTKEKLAKLKPAFVRPHGTHTAANSSFLTDGGAACLIMSEDKAKAMGYKPKAYIRNWAFTAVDPFEEMLLGPAYATAKVLKAAGLTVKDIDVWEIHEAFAGQVLSNIAALGSDKFGKENLGYDGKVGDIPFEKLNQWGGSLSLGHPFGATGSRLITTAANRLEHENGRFAILTACADGGLGHACLIERCP